jgi:hypothetical protein
VSCFVDVPFVLSRGDGQAGESVQPVTLYSSITVPANATRHATSPINTTSAIATELDVLFTEQGTDPTIAHVRNSIDPTGSVFATTLEPLPPPTESGLIETSTSIPPEPVARAETSPSEKALLDADEATKAISLTNTREGAVARIQWLMDALSPIAGVCHSAMSFYPIPDLADFRFQLNPYAQMAYSLLVAIPKVRRFVFLSEGNGDAMLI